MRPLQALSQHLLSKYGQEVPESFPELPAPSTPSSQRPTVPEPMGSEWRKEPMDQAEKSRENAARALTRARDILQSLQNHYAISTPGGFNNPPAPFHGYHAKMAELQHLLHYIEQIELNPIG